MAAQERKMGVLLGYGTIAIRNVVALLLIPFIIHHVGISHYGIYGLVTAIAGYLVILELGLANTVIRYVSKYLAEENNAGIERFIGMMLMIYGVLCVLVVAIGTAILLNVDTFFDQSFTAEEIAILEPALLILFLNVCLTLIGNCFTGIVSAHERFTFEQLSGLLIFSVRTLGVFVGLSLGFGIIEIIIVDTIANAIQVIIKAAYVKKVLKINPVFARPEREFLKEVYVYTLFIGLNVIVNQINWRVDNVIIGSLMDSKALGVFNIGNQLVFAFIAFASAITNVFTPKMVKMVTAGESKKALSDQLIIIGRYQMMVLSAVLILFLAFGPLFIQLFVGQSFSTAYWVAVIPMIPFIFVLAQSSTNAVLQGMNKHKVRSWLLLFTAIINVLISIVLVKEYGIVGASIGTAATLFIGELFLVNIYLQRYIGLDMVRFYVHLFKVLIPVFIPTLFLAYWLAGIFIFGWFDLIIGCAITLIAYSVLVFTFMLNSVEKRRVKAVFISR